MPFGARKTEQEVVANATGRRFSWLTKGVSITLGMVLAGVAAYAATNWIVGLSSNSSGEAQSATISNVTIRAVAGPSASNLLSPGGAGDVVVTVSNANPYPVTITAVQLPTSTTYATGYTTNALTATQAGCVASTPSDVTWSFATTSGSSHTLTTALTVAASGKADNPLTVTLTNDASMGLSAPLACANTYFSMPSLTGITATGGGSGTATTNPATDGWTS
jgi:hypothetical protein